MLTRTILVVLTVSLLAVGCVTTTMPTEANLDLSNDTSGIMCG